ncbi:MAG: MotA/TolQ/ExbB proton channel family protein [Gammaproteobacteria bacterium]|nr:MotA/TolQ/ExbB proton channel family protein [Gammaproteobacteria bacterium]
MFELVQAGGWLMLPIILASVVAVAIIAERFWTLRRKRIFPKGLVSAIIKLQRQGELNGEQIEGIRNSSVLGRVLAAGLTNMEHSREIMKESIEETGRQAILELERFLNALGTIASITPLLGLLGTVIGMIKVFSVITTQGVGDPGVLAGGISEALVTTAAGLAVAIPSLMFYRYFRAHVDELALEMEDEALRMVEVLKGDREAESGPEPVL